MENAETYAVTETEQRPNVVFAGHLLLNPRPSGAEELHSDDDTTAIPMESANLPDGESLDREATEMTSGLYAIDVHQGERRAVEAMRKLEEANFMKNTARALRRKDIILMEKEVRNETRREARKIKDEMVRNGFEIAEAQRRIDILKQEACDLQRRYDLATRKGRLKVAVLVKRRIGLKHY